ncbi:MAG: hypothetical protein DMG89_23985 [Acidobacteria bacterium]|nr:MAG: hypothetical protein DMG89_23985 [Acidobacteriota bacterium]
MEDLCQKCGKPVQTKMVAEECSVGHVDRKVIATLRNFHGHCLHCGSPFWRGKFGHHATLSVKQLKSKFPKSAVQKLRSALPASERQLSTRLGKDCGYREKAKWNAGLLYCGAAHLGGELMGGTRRRRTQLENQHQDKWSALEDDFRTFLLIGDGSETIFQQFTA